MQLWASDPENNPPVMGEDVKPNLTWVIDYNSDGLLSLDKVVDSATVSLWKPDATEAETSPIQTHVKRN